MMKKQYIRPYTELLHLHADANLCQGLAGISDKGGLQHMPGVRLQQW